MALAIIQESDQREIPLTVGEYKDLVKAKAQLEVIGEALRRSDYDAEVTQVITTLLGIEREKDKDNGNDDTTV